MLEPSSVDKSKIDVLILSSFDYKEMWKREFEGSEMEVIDVYDELEKVGIYCQREFYKLDYELADFELE